MTDHKHTPMRAFRSPDEVWGPAKARAASEGRTLTDVINTYLRRYGATQTRRGSAPTPKGGNRK